MWESKNNNKNKRRFFHWLHRKIVASNFWAIIKKIHSLYKWQNLPAGETAYIYSLKFLNLAHSGFKKNIIVKPIQPFVISYIVLYIILPVLLPSPHSEDTLLANKFYTIFPSSNSFVCSFYGA